MFTVVNCRAAVNPSMLLYSSDAHSICSHKNYFRSSFAFFVCSTERHVHLFLSLLLKSIQISNKQHASDRTQWGVEEDDLPINSGLIEIFQLCVSSKYLYLILWGSKLVKYICFNDLLIINDEQLVAVFTCSQCTTDSLPLNFIHTTYLVFYLFSTPSWSRISLLFPSLSSSLPLIQSFSSLILALFFLSSPATQTGGAMQRFLRCFKLLYKTAAQPDSAYCTTSGVYVPQKLIWT